MTALPDLVWAVALGATGDLGIADDRRARAEERLASLATAGHGAARQRAVAAAVAWAGPVRAERPATDPAWRGRTSTPAETWERRLDAFERAETQHGKPWALRDFAALFWALDPEERRAVDEGRPWPSRKPKPKPRGTR